VDPVPDPLLFFSGSAGHDNQPKEVDLFFFLSFFLYFLLPYIIFSFLSSVDLDVQLVETTNL
jgi:hypothetical protein